MSPFKLKVVGGDLEMSEVALDLPATLGRAPDVSLSLMHPLVSRHHCELFLVEGNVHVRDLGSLNGTFVGSQRIDESLLLPGDLLTIGTVTFRADYLAFDGDSPISDANAESSPTGTMALHAVAPRPVGQQVLNRGPVTSAGQARLGSAPSPMSETEPLRTDLSPLPARFVKRPVESRCEPS